MFDSPSRFTVAADDGVPLVAYVDGPADAELTVVFVHGHCQDSACWTGVGERLGAPAVRTVRYDQRGHGSSGIGDVESFTFDQLARDLDSVLRTLVPRGPVVLAGYSMGGMVSLAYARLQPATIGTRIVGFALVSTAAGGLADDGVGRYLRHPATSFLHRAVARAPRTMERSKRAGGAVCTMLGRRRSEDSWLRMLGMVLANETSVVTWSRLLAAFAVLDEYDAIGALAAVPVVVAAGTADRFVPITHSEAIVSHLPGAELVRIPGAGHRVLSESADAVARALGRLLTRVRDGALAPAG
ncbi:pimeloyl-ACP methyl ester carboxylesterase [Rhodococcus sp. SMB37]|uniref:alpha/beta fold hydrolase n=1 Tax=Rhodococcus sp. SMB37 TaxID=2512213 RepID=UPI00104BFF65|nr:alpha/beta fold hydrolase [Rhodococcus sp. SMB37]TCN46712.1 pimeloyl-ACP methyl ester carboxylesterase [Rhodococcus sp. SMB37]